MLLPQNHLNSLGRDVVNDDQMCGFRGRSRFLLIHNIVVPCLVAVRVVIKVAALKGKITKRRGQYDVIKLL